MFKNKLNISTVYTIGVIAVCAMNMVYASEFLTQITTHKVFLTHLCSKGCSPCFPIQIAIEVYSKHICSMIVKRIGLRIITKQFKAIHIPIPIDNRMKAKYAPFVFGLYSCICL